MKTLGDHSMLINTFFSSYCTIHWSPADILNKIILQFHIMNILHNWNTSLTFIEHNIIKVELYLLRCTM